MKNFIQRTISGAILVILIVGSILIHPISFAIVFAIICGLAVHEFHQLANKQPDIQTNPWLSTICGILLFACSYIYVSGIYSSKIYIIYAIALIATFISELYRRKSNPVHNWAYFLLGQIMVALPFSLLNYILYISSYQPVVLLSIFVIIWVNDTFAYLSGMTLGKHKLFERISPKKSWEGFIGGAIAALGAGYVFSLFVPEISILQWFIISEIIVIFGTFGDLNESLMKRSIGVKDSGNIIPGHGGLLDRFDSMMLAAPAVLIFLILTIK